MDPSALQRHHPGNSGFYPFPGRVSVSSAKLNSNGRDERSLGGSFEQQRRRE
jgi:hypothetical protein